MAYFLLDAEGRAVGPYSREDLVLFRDRGLLDPHALVAEEDHPAGRPLNEVLNLPARPFSNASPPRLPRESGLPESAPSLPSDSHSTRGLIRHLMLPLEDIGRLHWLDNRRILALAVVGLLPLVLLIYLHGSGDLAGSIWGVALYSSLLWALFFYITFSQPEVRLLPCVLAFVGSAVFSIGLVALARMIVPIEWVAIWITAPSLSTRWAGHLVGVAWVEELAKLFMLYFLWPGRPRPQVMMFYGLMCGLGFGIYEGVTYQSSLNLRISFPEGRATADGAGVYYMLNVLRLTSLPFLHAMWTGIAGYFIGFAAHYPARQRALLLVALVVPSLLHATYNTFSSSAVGVMVALLTVLALNVYLAKGRDFETVLAARRP
ncbi:MAG: PrsW family intramembrane metalloprotease [Verrucomicrobiae bacterium]|nr:PrsW family intramembrane metalloprotease [Verrucomicrobiae bacterium]